MRVWYICSIASNHPQAELRHGNQRAQHRSPAAGAEPGQVDGHRVFVNGHGVDIDEAGWRDGGREFTHGRNVP